MITLIEAALASKRSGPWSHRVKSKDKTKELHYTVKRLRQNMYRYEVNGDLVATILVGEDKVTYVPSALCGARQKNKLDKMCAAFIQRERDTAGHKEISFEEACVLAGTRINRQTPTKRDLERSVAKATEWWEDGEFSIDSLHKFLSGEK